MNRRKQLEEEEEKARLRFLNFFGSFTRHIKEEKRNVR